MTKLTHFLLTGSILAMACTTSVCSVFAAEGMTEAAQAMTEIQEVTEAAEVPEEKKSSFLDTLSGGLDSLSGALDSLSGKVGSLSDSLSEGDVSLDKLFGEGGVLQGVLPEGTSLDGLLGSAEKYLKGADGKVSEAVKDALGKVKSLDDQADLSALGGYVETLLGQVLGSGAGAKAPSDASPDYLEEIFRKYENVREAEKAYIRERNAGIMDPGDVQIVTITSIWDNTDQEQEDTMALSYVTQNNYTKDEEDTLRFLDSASDAVFFTLQEEEDGSYTVTDARFSEDGEAYTASLEAFCDEIGIPLEDCMSTIQFSESMAVYDLQQYLEEHPEFKGIEYEGEVYTADGLNTLQDEILNELFGEAE